jgi:hypothetical protein
MQDVSLIAQKKIYGIAVWNISFEEGRDLNETSR